jgi:hypothetical protein
MAAGLLELEKLCIALPGQIELAANEMVRDVVRVIDKDVVEHTPVDVTEAVSNWQANLNIAPSFPLPPIFPGKHGSTAQGSRSEAVAHVERTVRAKKPGEPVFLSNLADHIGFLNDGTSKQEPAGFVERAVRKGELFASSADLKVPE